MVENIELRSYNVRNEPDGDIAEYHEINQDPKQVESHFETEIIASKFETNSINDYDFFTQMDKKAEMKKSKKKKKSKRSETASNLMDIISSELASVTIPITEYRIELIEDRKDYQNSYLQSFSRNHRIQRRPPFIDSEYGQSKSSRAQALQPVFPNLLESFTEDSLPEIPVEYVGPSSFNDLVNENNCIDGQESIKFLDIALRDIRFRHHHNFSLEDILCMKLIENFNEYKNIQDTLKNLSHDIKVNRETKDNLKKDLLKVSPNKKDDVRLDATVRKYTGQLLQLKENYREVLKLEKEVIHKIISISSDVEMIREKFKCRDAPYNLRIAKHTLNKTEFEKEWNNLYEEEFTDMLAKVEFDYGTKCIEYKESKHDVNLENSRKKMNRPKMKIDEDAIKNEVEQLVNSIISRDKVEFSLEKDKRNIAEQRVIRNIYQFEIYVDKVFVCESESYTIADKWLNFTISESFSIEILPNNQTLRILLLENEEKVAQLKINISELQRKNSNDDFTKLEFTYDNDVLPTPHFVGSGHSIKEIAALNKVRLKSNNIFKGNLKTVCEVNVKMRLNENQNQSDAIKASMIIGSKLKRLLHGNDKPNLEVLTEIIGKIYGKDVSNDDAIINTLNNLCKYDALTSNEKFDINENSTEFVRLKLLHLRNNGGFTDVENKMIPIHGSQISTEQLNCLQKTKEKDIDLDYLKDKEVDMDAIELQRFIAAKYIQKLNTKMLKNLKEHLMVKTRKDVVCEYKNFSLRGLFSREKNISALAPVSNETKRQILMESLAKDQEIRITVQRAFNLLDRSTALIEEGDSNEERIAEPVTGYKVRSLRPFVRVSYRGASARTVTAIGCHPTWNHTLKICSKLEPLSALHIDIFDECKVNISEDSDEQATLGRTVHYRYHNRWLGTAQVPLFTVLSLGSLRGTFKISSPPILFGYETEHNKESRSLIPEITQLMKKDTSHITLHITTGLAHLGGFQEFNQPLPSSEEDNYIIKHLNTFVTNYTNDFPNRNISLTFIDSAGRNKCVTQFLQPIPPPDRECFPKNPKSCGSAMSKSSGYSRSSSSKSSGRREVDVEANEEKESVHSQEGNFRGDGLVKMINACLRFVALIPSYEVNDNHVVTLTGLELLKVLHGSPLDHTILLASYFLYLGIKSWVAIGSGLPRGRSAYVLIQYDLTARRFVLTSDEVFRSRGFLNRNDGCLWYVCDALSGDRHELRDVGCPMMTVEYVFDNENIWVNVQSSKECENVSFDLSRSSDWTPVFDKNIFVMKQPIVNDSQLYSSPGDVASLRQSLEAKIKGKVQKWRPHMKTIWNRYCSGLLRDALPFWEYWAFNPSENKPGFSQKVKQLMVTYRMYGFPLNLSFVNTKTMISAVKASALHTNDDPTVEFALGVEVYAYPNNVLSVWVFLATISRV